MNRTVLSINSIEWRCAALRSRSVPTLSGTQSSLTRKGKFGHGTYRSGLSAVLNAQIEPSAWGAKASDDKLTEVLSKLSENRCQRSDWEPAEHHGHAGGHHPGKDAIDHGILGRQGQPPGQRQSTHRDKENARGSEECQARHVGSNRDRQQSPFMVRWQGAGTSNPSTRVRSTIFGRFQ